jgi:hypothetical protein
MEFADSMRGYDAAIRKATDSLLRSAELGMRKDGGHFEQ